MKKVFVLAGCIALFFSTSMAADSTLQKKLWYLHLNIGYGANSVGGSMVDHNNQYYSLNKSASQQKNMWGFVCSALLSKELSKRIYFKTGFSYSQKNVNPQEYSSVIFKDTLSTSYLGIPLLVGTKLPLDKKRNVLLFVETGVSGNIKVNDKSHSGPDRESLSANSSVLSFLAGCGILMNLNKKVAFSLQYQFSTDLTSAYDETLYVGYSKTYSYKYQSNVIQIGASIRLAN